MNAHQTSGRIRWGLSALLVAPVIAGVPAVLAAEDSASGVGVRHSPAAGSVQFTLRLKDRALHIVDVPPRGDQPTLGDYAAFNKILLTPSGHRAGKVQAHGMITQAGKDPVETIEGVMILEGGRLMVEESFHFPDRRHHIAITGGTGDYAGATGTVSSGLPGQGPNDLLFEVKLP